MGQITQESVQVEGFLEAGSQDRVTQVMGYHPTYLDIFIRTHNFILHGDGPLPYDYRHFIGIMAAGRHQCGYLIDVEKQEFLAEGGDEAWLKGLSHVPKKLKQLYELNKVLAHRPWLIDISHIQKLTKGSDNWSLAELVHAIVLLAHFHSLSSFVFACGLNEVEPAESKPAAPLKEDSTKTKESDTTTCQVGVAALVERLRTLSERIRDSAEQGPSTKERDAMFEKVEVELSAPPKTPAPSIEHFIEDPSFVYEDFARRTPHIPTFRVQDYSWGDHGYSLVNRLYNDIGNLIDDKFKTAYNLTYYTMGGRRDVDTSRFRRAIWNYIHCMFGIRHDDYDYSEVNQLLERSLKSFIKTACCFPERVTKADYERVLREFRHSERVHINLMILEARMQAELLYALRALMRYMT